MDVSTLSPLWLLVSLWVKQSPFGFWSPEEGALGILEDQCSAPNSQNPV